LGPEHHTLAFSVLFWDLLVFIYFHFLRFSICRFNQPSAHIQNIQPRLAIPKMKTFATLSALAVAVLAADEVAKRQAPTGLPYVAQKTIVSRPED